jgi:IS5 family transposase
MCLKYTAEDGIGKHLSHMFPIRNGLKQGDALSPLLFIVTLECSSARVHVNQDGFKLKDTHRLLVWVTMWGGCVRVVEKNTEHLLAASKETGIQVNADTANYMVRLQDEVEI